MTPVERIGHRGSPRLHLENTLPSFQAAFEHGAEAVELDVHVTADGIAVVHHDAVLGATATPISYRHRPIQSLGSADLASLRLVDPADVLYEIPTLSAVLNLAEGRGMVYVEIKSGAENIVAAVLAAHHDHCAVHSFDHDVIQRLSKTAPGLPLGILIDRAPTDVVKLMRNAGARDIWPEWRLIDRRLVDQVHEAGGRVIAWTVNETAVADALINAGVDGICSDDLPAIGLIGP